MKIEERAAHPTLANATVPAESRVDRRRNNAAASIVPSSVTNNDHFEPHVPRSFRDHGVHVRHDRPEKERPLNPAYRWCVQVSTEGSASS